MTAAQPRVSSSIYVQLLEGHVSWCLYKQWACSWMSRKMTRSCVTSCGFSWITCWRCALSHALSKYKRMKDKDRVLGPRWNGQPEREEQARCSLSTSGSCWYLHGCSKNPDVPGAVGRGVPLQPSRPLRVVELNAGAFKGCRLSPGPGTWLGPAIISSFCGLLICFPCEWTFTLISARRYRCPL